MVDSEGEKLEYSRVVAMAGEGSERSRKATYEILPGKLALSTLVTWYPLFCRLL